MPRTKNRARRRRARAEAEHARVAAEIETLWERICRARTADDRIAANDELVRLLIWVADSEHLRLWDFFPDEFWGRAEHQPNLVHPTPSGVTPRPPNAGAKVVREAIDATRALIAQLVAPNLAGKPLQWVLDRK